MMCVYIYIYMEWNKFLKVLKIKTQMCLWNTKHSTVCAWGLCDDWLLWRPIGSQRMRWEQVSNAITVSLSRKALLPKILWRQTLPTSRSGSTSSVTCLPWGMALAALSMTCPLIPFLSKASSSWEKTPAGVQSSEASSGWTFHPSPHPSLPRLNFGKTSSAPLESYPPVLGSESLTLGEFPNLIVCLISWNLPSAPKNQSCFAYLLCPFN